MTVLLSDVFVKITRRDSQFFARLRVQFEKCLSNNNSMFKPYLTYFLLALLALQSVVATSDAHQSHQSGAEHLNFDTSHQHADETEHFDHNSESESQHSDWDCHHCCHCHGHLSSMVLSTVVHLDLSLALSAYVRYVDAYPPEIFDSFLRPPIA